MENAKNYNNLKHLSFPKHCKALFQNSEETGDLQKSQDSSSDEEVFSRKVFVGGLPPDIAERAIEAAFTRFGTLSVDWPHKSQSSSYFPPKGYAFLIFQRENSVVNLLSNCFKEDDKYFIPISSPSIINKLVQVRPWCLKDADHVFDESSVLDARLTVFVGGVPRPLRAVELAEAMNGEYKNVCYAGIDADLELKYPKGAGRVVFSNRQSYISAISSRFFQLQLGDIDKRIEMKPFVLDGQQCDECGGQRSNGQLAPYFCANVNCLQYFCECCWAAVHSRLGFCDHQPLVKEGGLRPRPFQWR